LKKSNPERKTMNKLKMNKSPLAALLLAGTLVVPTLEANQMKFTNPAWRDQSYGGGEFGVDLLGDGTIEFYTFSLERNEGLSFGTIYDYTIGTGAVGGGLSGGNPDTISQGTAFLFTLFSDGTLPGYSYATDNPAARASSGLLLQNAIWGLEHEMAANLANPFIALAVAHFGGSVGATISDYSGAEVRVLNPPSGVTSVLTRQPDESDVNVPDAGGTGVLLAGSLMLIGIARRRLS
jgi:hypothetical protein